VKTPPKLLYLRQYNSQLRRNKWVNYSLFLGTLLRSTSCTASLPLLELFEKGKIKEMVLLADSLASAEYSTSAEHRLVNQLCAVVRKFPFPKEICDLDAKGTALKTFLSSERKCSLVNRRFKLFDSLRSPHEGALNAASSWIRYVLGDSPNFERIWSHCDFGPGASLGIHGNATNQARKLLSPDWTVTPGAFYYAMASMKTDPHIRELLVRAPDSRFFSFDNDTFNQVFKTKVRIVNNNKICFVPKTAKTERTIAVEPLLNGYIQKGIDVEMRNRLKRVGIDLDDQSINQKMAHSGSLPGQADPYATIDLSSASDSISIGLCKRLLPPDWFDFLNSVRSKSFIMEGVEYPYHKFTTMGNGFCFPLETLIFASLCHISCVECQSPIDFNVYGDDIIVRSSVAPRVLELLRVCGFKANPSKTFLRGPFRESCGADWFEGEDVRPVNLDYDFDSLENIFKFCNIVRMKDIWLDIFREALLFLKSLIPSSLKFVRPYTGNADTCLEVDLDEFMTSPFCRWSRTLHCWSWTELVKTSLSDTLVERLAGYDVVLTRGALKGTKASTPFAERRKTRTKIRRVSYGGGWSLYLPGEILVNM